MEIRLNQVTKSYKDIVALKNINLNIPQGMFGILGPNGAGKTTLMKILMALLPADCGEITIDNISIKERDKIRGFVSYLPQDFSFYPNMSVYESLDYMALLAGVRAASKRNEIINDLLSKVNLKKYKKTKFRALSGGMKRRLGIAISLLKDPKVLIVDEPTAGLDPDERVRFRTLLSEFAKDRIVVLSTHIVADIEHTCSNIAIMDQGEIIFYGERQQLIDEATGKVRVLEVDLDELKEIQSKYYVISINQVGGGFAIRIISDENIGEIVKPNMEDAYLVKMYNENRVSLSNYEEL